MKAGLDYLRSRRYAYLLTFYSANNADAEIMLRPKFTFSKRCSSCYRKFLSAFAGIYNTTVFGKREANLFINHYKKNAQGHIFTINECQLVYIFVYF